MVSGADSFSAVDLGPTVSTGIDPSLAATDQGAVALGWYDTLAQNQMIGYLGNVTDIVVARPSPSLTTSEGPPPGGATCGQDKTVQLDQDAVGTTFTESCLVAAPRGIHGELRQPGRRDHRTTSRCSTRQGGKQTGRTDVAASWADRADPDLDLKAGHVLLPMRRPPDQMFGTLAVVDGGQVSPGHRSRPALASRA